MGVTTYVVVCVCAALAAARGGAARPEPGTELFTVSSDQITAETTENLAATVDQSTESGQSAAATAAAAAEAAAAAAAVHRRFPSAVLFGGICGGTVIGERWVLTAAHCTIFSAADSVVAGTGRTDDDSGVTRSVKRLVIHPLFTVGPYWLNANEFNISQVGAHWDFLLAELDETLPLDNTSIAAVPLDDEGYFTEGTPVAYAGYGAENHGEVMRNEMHAMELEMVADDACARLQQFSAEDMFCAKGRAPKFDSACSGDSGSGLLTDGEGPRRLLGVASWVQDDAHECSPGKLVVFSKIAAVRGWIKQITGI